MNIARYTLKDFLFPAKSGIDLVFVIHHLFVVCPDFPNPENTL